MNTASPTTAAHITEPIVVLTAKHIQHLAGLVEGKDANYQTSIGFTVGAQGAGLYAWPTVLSSARAVPLFEARDRAPDLSTPGVQN